MLKLLESQDVLTSNILLTLIGNGFRKLGGRAAETMFNIVGRSADICTSIVGIP